MMILLLEKDLEDQWKRKVFLLKPSLAMKVVLKGATKKALIMLLLI